MRISESVSSSSNCHRTSNSQKQATIKNGTMNESFHAATIIVCPPSHIVRSVLGTTTNRATIFAQRSQTTDPPSPTDHERSPSISKFDDRSASVSFLPRESAAHCTNSRLSAYRGLFATLSLLRDTRLIFLSNFRLSGFQRTAIQGNSSLRGRTITHQHSAVRHASEATSRTVWHGRYPTQRLFVSRAYVGSHSLIVAERGRRKR